VPAFAYANFPTLTSSFGGRVITPDLPIATCYGLGTGPVVLASSIESLGSAVESAAGVGGQTTPARVNNVVSGIYGAIPFYTTFSLSADAGGGFHFVGSVPKTGDWILGRASVIPSFTTCTISDTVIPFPVRKTSDYKTSGAAL